MEQPHRTLHTFEEAWDYFDEIGIPVEELTEEQYNKLMGKIVEKNIDEYKKPDNI